MSYNPSDAVSHVVSDFTQAKGNDFTQASNDLYALRGADMTHFQQNLDQINQQVDFKKLGFRDDFVIDDVRPGSFLASSSDGKQQALLSAKGLNPETAGAPADSAAGAGTDSTAAAQTPGSDANANPGKIKIGDHNRELQANSDGSMTFTAKANNGDCYWRMAADVLKTFEKKTPTDTEVANLVNDLATANQKSDPNKLAVGEQINIPKKLLDKILGVPEAAASPADASANTEAQPTGDNTTAQAPATDSDTTTAAAAPGTDSTTPAPVTGADTSAAAAAPFADTTTVAATPSTDSTTVAAAPGTDSTTVAAAPGTDTTTQAPATASDTIAQIPPPGSDTTATPTTGSDTTQPATPAIVDVSKVVGITPYDARIQSKDNVFNPLAPPAEVLAKFGDPWSDTTGITASGNKDGEIDAANGDKTTKYSGYLKDGWIVTNGFAAGYASEETVNAQGSLIHRKTDYTNGGFGNPKFTFVTPDGTIDIDTVQTVETSLNQDASGYQTKITDTNGQVWNATSTLSGIVTSFDGNQPDSTMDN